MGDRQTAITRAKPKHVRQGNKQSQKPDKQGKGLVRSGTNGNTERILDDELGESYGCDYRVIVNTYIGLEGK